MSEYGTLKSVAAALLHKAVPSAGSVDDFKWALDQAESLILGLIPALAESKRESRWHATYNAALSGMVARSWHEPAVDTKHRLMAADYANELHGELKK